MADNNLFPGQSLIKTAARGLALAAAIAVASTAAAELQLVPLEDYLSQNHIGGDPAAMAYVAKRCAAWYLVFAKGLEGETDPARQQALRQADAKAEKFLEFATKLEMSGRTIDPQTSLAHVKDGVVAIAKLYQNRIDHAQNLTGNMFSDPLLAGDLKICGALAA